MFGALLLAAETSVELSILKPKPGPDRVCHQSGTKLLQRMFCFLLLHWQARIGVQLTKIYIALHAGSVHAVIVEISEFALFCWHEVGPDQIAVIGSVGELHIGDAVDVVDDLRIHGVAVEQPGLQGSITTASKG